MTIRAGVLSDTHLMQTNEHFNKLLAYCFHDCDVIIHAGDLTDLSILEAFTDQTVYAVHGNMCNKTAQRQLPGQLLFPLGRFHIGLCHGAGLGIDREDALWNLFPEADCIIYGHTHRARCQRSGSVLFFNPGSFQASSPYGAPGTYGILEFGEKLHAHLFDVPHSL